MHYVALRSAMHHLRPERVIVHCDELPFGLYWDAIRPEIELQRVSRIPQIDAAVPTIDAPERYRYAHHADVIRLDALLEHGGVYLDLDTVTLADFPASWWEQSFVIGAETLSDEEHADLREAPNPETDSLLNAVMMAEPGSPFVRRWRERILDRYDGTWSGHSCRLASELARESPHDVFVVPPAAFADFPPTIRGMQMLLDEPSMAGDATAGDRFALHLCAHLWWNENRTDFLTLSGSDLTERWYQTSNSPYARAARPHLPDLLPRR